MVGDGERGTRVEWQIFPFLIYIGRRAEEDRARVASGQATPRRERETEKGRRPQIFAGSKRTENLSGLCIHIL
jgi:hypothetical protein